MAMIIKKNKKYYYIINGKEYLITEVEDDQFFYRDENGVEHAVDFTVNS